jgi:hypothetical protein
MWHDPVLLWSLSLSISLGSVIAFVTLSYRYSGTTFFLVNIKSRSRM